MSTTNPTNTQTMWALGSKLQDLLCEIRDEIDSNTSEDDALLAQDASINKLHSIEDHITEAIILSGYYDSFNKEALNVND